MTPLDTDTRPLEVQQVQILRLEGVALAGLGLVLFAATGASWWLFAALILVPDAAFAAYWLSARVGSAVYNIIHSYVSAVLLLALGWFGGVPVAMVLGAILMVHIGADRALGFGLKNTGQFKRTHLSLG